MANPTSSIAKFNTLLEAEQGVRSATVGSEFGMDIATRARAHADLCRAKDRLSTLIDSLSLEELVAYGAYRREVLGANAAR